jgi:hypothetical protein
MSGGIYDWARAPRALFEQLAHESVTYWHTPGPGPKPLSTELCRTLDELCAAARVLRTIAEVDAEMGRLQRELETLPRPIDLDEVSRIRRRISELCREPTAPYEGIDYVAEWSEDLDRAEARELAAGAADLRARLVNIYHLTLTGGADPVAALQAIRAASGPGAPAPPAGSEHA